MGKTQVQEFVKEFAGTMVLSDAHKAKARSAQAIVGKTYGKPPAPDNEETKALIEQEDRLWKEFSAHALSALPEAPIQLAVDKETLESLLKSAYSRMVDPGRKNYGPYRPGTDKRDKARESFEEMDDVVVYTFFDHCDRLLSGKGDVEKLLPIVITVALVKKAIENAK